MKKRLSVILMFMLFLPFTINAASTYNNGVTKSNNYIISFKNYKRYILIPSNSKFYSYEKSGYINNNQFKNGGFISSYEYNLSIYNNVSWLAPGVGYWTLSKANNNEYYCISNTLYSKNANDMSEVRVTQYIQPSSIIKGNGTITNPWYFAEAFTIKLKSNNEEYGNLGTSSNPGPQEIYVEKGSTKSTDYIVTPGYEISTSNISNCSSDYFLVNNNKLTIRSLDRDLNCVINFEPKKLKVKLDSAGGEITSNTLNVIYSQEYGEIPTPTRKGYIFEGWYTKTTGGTKVTAETKVTETKGHTLYARWKAEMIKCSELTYECKNTSKGSDYNLTYSGKCEVICENENWKIKFLTSGKLTTTTSLNIDVFLVGGGGGGYYSDGFSGENGYPYGGGGGYTKTIKNVTYPSGTYNVEIGAGGGYSKNGGTSKFDIYSANGGYSGKNGGAGGSGGATIFGSGGRYGNNGHASNMAYTVYQPGKGGKGQGTTTCEFGEGTLKKCNGGRSYAYSGGGSAGGNSEEDYTPGGGASCFGGGCGNGANNTGGGGAGYCCEKSTKGGSGIVIIRNKR